MNISIRSRELFEMSRSAFWEQFDLEPGIDKDGFYPGQQEYEQAHAKEVAKREKASERAFKKSLAALLDEAEHGR